MARSRNIKPGFFKNDELAECRPLARLLFAGLWTLADREGRLWLRPARIKAELLPYDNCDINELLDELREHNFIRFYEVDEKQAIDIPGFTTHQNPHRNESESEIAPWRDSVESPHEKERAESDCSASNRADSLNLIPDSLNPLTDSLSTELSPKSESSGSQVENLFLAYPRRVAKGAALKAIKKSLKLVDYETLLAAVEEFAKSPVGQSGQFCPHPATWFNAERWNDDRAEWQTAGDGKKRVLSAKERCPTNEELEQITVADFYRTD